MHYTQEQIDRANAVSLEDFLRSQGEELIKSGSEYRWKKHDSLTVCENKWFRHSQSKGGFPVDFVMEFYDKSFPEAVALLLNDTGYSPDRNEPQFRLPARSDSKKAAYRYLSEKRKIAPSLLDVFFKAGDIFEDAAHRNVVFIGRDKDGIPRCAHARGMEDQSRRDVSGSDKSCGFSYRGIGNQLFVFEAPIDLLSFICLYSDKWMQRSYVSLGGVSGKALDCFLSERRDVRKVFLCTDNDEAGNAAAQRLAQSIADGIEVIRFSPAMKDWNEVLCHAERFPNRKYHAESFTMKDAAAETPVPMIRMSDVVGTDVEWLWKPYIPFGKVSILQGNPGEGKTYFAMQLAAACTNRKTLPCMDELEPFNMMKFGIRSRTQGLERGENQGHVQFNKTADSVLRRRRAHRRTAFLSAQGAYRQQRGGPLHDAGHAALLPAGHVRKERSAAGEAHPQHRAGVLPAPQTAPVQDEQFLRPAEPAGYFG